MLIEIEALLETAELAALRQQLLAQDWVDGQVTAGVQSARVKANRQLPEDNLIGRQLGELILRRLSDNALFMSAALPKRIYPPLFNRYGDGEAFGFHVDNAVRGIKGVRERVRTDLSATLFLAEPQSYDGGELVIRDTFGERRVKLPAGHLVLYPGSSLHRVEPVSRGERLASFFWIESLVREDSQRQMLLDMDVAIQRLTVQGADEQSLLELTGVYHNLLRRWSDT
ncbi:Fe2+-dependent dioxygenase [Pseudomonas daroniae]|uniref:Fe2+-dependent dioxygenase n=1 Tax=Phytopseudomonas daroniae TaxID=2487519 RepID=A0A4Q9QGN9_9GAMM|nr:MULTISPECIES: Fe2+-dependent dioxygenase [Pseudomonas]TBU73098.1 Fe2+-dependent dioxygenase [Pseudomonas daroniae]TBU77789.1 Fe2+-dependent dioxygenase [Pseudomonas sp. FRB 228]TBU87870.1 Fe2+-dependent dioxygenase [Pseudomonas daroniae]